MQVKQGIEELMDFVMVTAHPNNTVNLDLSQNGLKTLSDTVLHDIKSIKRHLVVTLFDLQEQSEVESLVQNYQSTIIKLLNDLFTYQRSHTENSLINFYTSLSDSLLNVLTYIETYFSKYFNIDEEIPHFCYSLNIKEFQQKISNLNIRFKDEVDLELIAIVTSHYAILESGVNKKTITYRDLIYRKELIRELNSLVSDSSMYKSVKEVLLHVNFNHIELFKYLIDKLQEKYNKSETLEAKLELLKYQRKQFRQMLIKPNFALFFPFPSIKEQILNWVEEEIFFLEDQIIPSAQEPEKKDVEPALESKISVALSVAQLGVFIRVLTLGKVITNNNQLEVIKIFASIFKTYKTEDISYGSLYGKYYKPEASAIKEIKGILLKLVGLITKMKE